MVGHFAIAFFALAAVVLAVTGAEALYADMGHFGRRAITRGWLFLVLPACVLNYLGQGALLLGDEGAARAPFFLLTPDWARVPMVLLATAATVIASQAVITGAYSVASQAAQLGYLPRLRIAHTSASTIGQIYVPWINGVLMVSVLTLVFAFRSSAALAYAFGMAVTGTITITTLLFLYIARTRWGTPLWLVVIGGGALLLVDLMFLAANMTKLVHGAWLPLLIAVIAFTVMTTWQRGRQVVTRAREQAEGPLREFIDGLADCQPPLLRIPGTAVFLNRGKQTAPLAMRANVKHNHVLHEHVVIVAIDTAAGAARIGLRADGSRSSRPCQGRDLPCHRALRVHGNAKRPRRTTPARPDPDRRPDRHRRRFLLPVEAGTDQGCGTDHGALAQAACSSRPPTSPPTPPITSACPPTARSSWVRGSRSRFCASYLVPTRRCWHLLRRWVESATERSLHVSGLDHATVYRVRLQRVV